jgi:hypothetical protein
MTARELTLDNESLDTEVARLCGWTMEYVQSTTNGRRINRYMWFPREHKPPMSWMEILHFGKSTAPNYTINLNECAEMEKELGEQRLHGNYAYGRYVRYLHMITRVDGRTGETAGPRERCIAFVLAMREPTNERQQ